MKASCVVLTMGDRPDHLSRAVASVLAQSDVGLEIVVVANGADVAAQPPPVRVLRIPTNVGAPGGRNRAIPETTGDVLFFLDDDTSYPDTRLVVRALALFEEDPALGIISFRVEDPLGHPGQRRHVPRLRAGDRERSSDVTTFLEGACAIRRVVFERVGPYPDGFVFGHEATDLAWRALDAGFRIRYQADLVVHHPSEPPTRHDHFNFLTSRNRVFLARRRLPWPLAVTYCAVWLALGLARARSVRGALDQLRGFWRGLVEPAGERAPLRWRTVWIMVRLGRPPIV